MADVKNGIQTGVCDNLSGVLCCSQLIGLDKIHIEFTNGEETNMEGARWVADRYSTDDTFLIVVDVTEKAPRWKSTQFTIENINGIDLKHIKKALKNFQGKYKVKETGAESEAWLYKKEGFSCIEIDIVVTGGLHNLHNRAQVVDILVASEAIKAIVEYVKDKEKKDICEAVIATQARK
jgi:putative aminopeptidase FrvX